MGFKEVKQFKTCHVLCDGEWHIIGNGGSFNNGVEKTISATALGEKKKCDCNE